MLKFTYITVTYNASAVLNRTLDSVAEQDYPCIEHVIVDGLSKDDTFQKATDYAQRVAQKEGHEVRLLHEKDSGLYDAMNKGIHLASGHYICFLNAGDVLPSKDTVSRLAQCIGTATPLPAVVYGDTAIVDNEGTFLRRRRLTPPESLSSKSFMKGMLVCHQSFYARTDLAKQELYNLNYRYSADFDWCVRLMKHAERNGDTFKNSHLVLTNYLEEGMTTRHHKASLKERFYIMCHHYGRVRTLALHAWFVLRALYKK